jgi:hypothetical protein
MRRTCALLLISMMVPALAAAQTEPTAEAVASPNVEPLSKENWPLNRVDRPLGLSGGMLQVDVNGAMSLSKAAVAKPVTLPLSLLYGVTDDLQAAILHNRGLCLSGKENRCPKVYDDISLQVLFSLFGRGTPMELATWAQLNFFSFDPATLGLQIGGAVNWMLGDSALLVAYPNLGIGLTQREPVGRPANTETIAIPVALYFTAGTQVAPVLFTGLGTTSLDAPGDSYSIPMGLGVLVGLSPLLDVGARFDLPRFIAKRAEAEGAADVRSLSLWVSLRPL